MPNTLTRTEVDAGGELARASFERVAEELVDARYELRARLGAGGMGVVREALDTTCGRVVAIKTLHVAPGKDSLAVRRRFEREVAAIGSLRSPNVVELLGHGVTKDGTPYLVMERLFGRDLSELLERQARLAADDVLAILAELACALDAAHALGIVHRDVKPSNVFLAEGEGGSTRVKLLDFGIAKELHSEGFDGTTTGAAVGTPCFMSPEQIMGKRTIDHRSDLWSLGVLAFRALTGTYPFQGESVGALAVALHSGVRPSVRSLCPELPRPIDDWFARACALSLDERFQSAHALVSALAKALGTEVPASVRSSTIAQAVLERAAGSPTTCTLDVDVSWVPERGSARVAPSHRDVRKRALRRAGGMVALLALGGVVAALVSTEPSTERSVIAPQTARTPAGDLPGASTTPEPGLSTVELPAVAPLPSPSTGLPSPSTGAAIEKPVHAARPFRRMRGRPSTVPAPASSEKPLSSPPPPGAPADADQALELDMRR